VAVDRGLVRLSTYVLFVDYGAEVEVQHTVRGSVHRVGRVTYEDLLRFRGFRAPAEQHVRWIDAGVLVPPLTTRTGTGPARSRRSVSTAGWGGAS
jgi:hypothetical protein